MWAMQNAKPTIKSFKIFGLYGKRNVYLDFNTNIKIYVGENGIGKTTILNIFYYTLSQQFNKLKDIEFDSIEVVFSDSVKVFIKREWLMFEEDEDFSSFVKSAVKRLKNFLTTEEIETLINEVVKKQSMSLQNFLDKYRSIFRERKIPVHIVSRDIEFITKNFDIGILEIVLNDSLQDIRRVLSARLNGKILYLPTYRRIEEDLSKLGLIVSTNKVEKIVTRNAFGKETVDFVRKNITTDTELIQFGMDDVQNLIKNFTEEIKDSAIKGYSEVTGKMISQLVQENTITEEMRDSIKNIESLNIVLDRVGSNLSEDDKRRIRQLITNNDIFQDTKGNYNLLIYFLYNLINIYNQQRDKDNAIKTFAKVCSGYMLPNKYVAYDENLVKIAVKDQRSGEDVELSQLSSGEKQIVSLFSKLYLTDCDEIYLLIDEPELSLSIEWQQKLLPDVVNSGKCKLLLAVTHSPFIYTDNSLDEYADSMELCIEEITYEE